MERKAQEVKKEYAKPKVSRVKLIVEGPVLGSCWTDNTTEPYSFNCNTLNVCFA